MAHLLRIKLFSTSLKYGMIVGDFENRIAEQI